ncbi:hypothetical protein AURDEDRAFT_117216 [Auricularia subglabra TFB-10046 SS5]|uniref:Acyltransferase MbtK/IucB-like conserved domain-containing protein n=1 Tax=Auricularia subglabra (strain TFB-10046 / SS5) TaxID=717982 RepID=J0WTS5_AURST|nr:hypothetical protein AURDEDRAFT_117216 [Auricularia subglabra TFB-10046 SS5]
MSLTLVPPSSPRPDDDNTPPGRASRAPLYALADSADADPLALLAALFDTADTTAPEWARVRLPGPGLSGLREKLLALGVGVPSFAPRADADADAGELLLLREAFWQLPQGPWLRVPPTSGLPRAHTYAAGKGRVPLRPAKPEPGTLLYARAIPHLGGEVFTVRVLDAGSAPDVAIFSAWQNSPRVAAAWRQTGTLEEHRAYLEASQNDPHVVPVLGSFGGEDALYAELYWAAEDSVGAHVPHLDVFDRGIHLLVGSEKHRGPHRVAAWAPSLAHALFLWDARTQRIVMEPRATNAKIARCMARGAGFVHTRTFDFPHKRAALLELTRERFFALAPFGFDGELPAAEPEPVATGVLAEPDDAPPTADGVAEQSGTAEGVNSGDANDGIPPTEVSNTVGEDVAPSTPAVAAPTEAESPRASEHAADESSK